MEEMEGKRESGGPAFGAETPKDVHLKSLIDLGEEIEGVSEPARIGEIFLLTAMGSQGIRSAFILLLDRVSQKGQLISRGLEDLERQYITENLPRIFTAISTLPQGPGKDFPVTVRVLDRGDSLASIFLPDQIKFLIQWSAGNGRAGFWGFGEKITHEEYHPEDRTFLHSLAHNLILSLNQAQTLEWMGVLNRELEEKNIRLAKAHQEAEQTQSHLDRQLYYLRTLYEITSELSSQRDTGKIMEKVLLMTLGAFSVQQGCLLFFDYREKKLLEATRGLEREDQSRFSEGDLEIIRAYFLREVKENKLLPMKAQFLRDEKFLKQMFGFLNPGIGLVFMVDEFRGGLIGLGKRITGADYSEEDRELMGALMKHFMIFMERARSFEKIQALNQDLEQRNVQLQKTILELTMSRKKIERLQETGPQITSAITKELERSRRASFRDLLFIVVLGLAIGLIYNFANPEGIRIIPQAWSAKTIPGIDVRWAKLKYDAGNIVFVDARPENFFNQGHIQGAVNLPPALFDFIYLMKLKDQDPAREIIVYGRNISRHYDQEVAFHLQSKGHAKVSILSGGLPLWQQEGFPLGP